MNSHHSEDGNTRDPLFDYIDGDPDAIRAAAPYEPSELEWEEAQECIHAQLAAARTPKAEAAWFRRRTFWLATSAVLTASAAALAWVSFHTLTPQQNQNPQEPAVVEVKPTASPTAPQVAESPDPLAEFAVLPMATNDDVVLHRVPGDGWLPVGAHPLPGTVSLATTDDVELDDPNPAWPSVTVTPGAAPMIFAAKPR